MMYNTPEFEMLSTIIYIILIFFSVVLSVMGSIIILSFLTRRKIDVKEEIVFNQNIGIALVLSSFIWTIGRMCLESAKPIMNEWYNTMASGITFKSLTTFSVGILGALLNALLIGAITVFLALKILIVINKGIDVWSEIKQGNIAVAIVISITVIVVGMFFESIISYIVMSLFRF